MIHHIPIQSLRVTITGLRYILLTVLVCLHLNAAAVDCEIDGFVPPDTLIIERTLGDCEISTLEILDSLNLDGCPNIQLIPAGPYSIPISKPIYVYDLGKDSIYSSILLLTKATSLDGVNGIVEDTNGVTTIPVPLGAGECTATKNQLLDQLNVDQDEIYRSQIHLLSGTSRITEFPIGDTVFLDAIECSGSQFYQDLNIIFTPGAPTFSNVMVIDHPVTTCPVTIDEVFDRLGYDTDSCAVNRFDISDNGPFGYGPHVLEFIKLDAHFILKDAVVNVVPSGCNTDDIDFGMLQAGKCALNEYDILDTLGLANSGCGIESINIFPPGPYESSPVTITKIDIGGVTVCNSPFDVIFVRDTSTQETGSIICHQDLNIAMGPECLVAINADVILDNGNYCYLNYIIDLSFADAPDDVITSGHEVIITQPGMYSLVITNPATGNSCWSEFKIEDKYIEDIKCIPDTLWCYESIDLVPDDTLGGGPDFPDIGPGTIYTSNGITNQYNVNSATLCGVAFARYEDDLVDDCINDFKLIIDRLWTFEDNYGNSDTCLQRIYVRNSTLDLILPFTAIEVNCISDFELLDGNGNPSPKSSGYPMISPGLDAGICGTLKMNYQDTELPLCGLGKKIIRQWVIIDWCSEEVKEKVQVIRIEDKESPVITDTLPDISIDSDPFICGGTNIDLPLPTFEDCNIDDIILEIIYETYNDFGQLIKKSNGSSLFINEIKTIDIISTFNIEYILTDPCGNEARDTLELTISDNEPPVAVCDEFTIISVGGNGNALVKAETFDDLSVDNCGILKYEARKLTGRCDLTGEFASDLRFCCDEVGDTLIIEFKVTDLAGNFNLCEVRVSIQDKFKPIIKCPADITLDCGMDYTDLDITGSPETRDNCDFLETFFIDDVQLNQCHQGTVVRTWMVRDKGGFTESCIQVITVEEDTLFNMDQALFPADTIIMGCNASLLPEFTGSPEINTSSCAMVDATYSDLFFYDVENACVKILREWTIIDWCQRDETNSGIWKNDQIIKLISDIGPVFLTEARDTSYCINSTQCADFISITGIAEDGDACTPAEELVWSYILIDDQDDLIESGNRALVEALLESGNYKVIFEARDGCDNTSLDTIFFEVVDCRPPIMSCPSVQPSLVLDPFGEVRLYVSDIVDVTVSDNCDAEEEIIISFDAIADSTVMDFSCADIENGIGDRFISLYARDMSGNIDSCELYLELRDNSSYVCGGKPTDTISVAGLITTVALGTVKDVKVTLSGGNISRSMTTTNDGKYAFEYLARENDYEIEFEKNTGHDDGVTTIDILLTQRHILSISTFESPYQVIAADVNNNGRISATDLVGMRRLVLGIDSTFSINGQQSWRFVDAIQTFDEVRLPFPFTDRLFINNLNRSLKGLDFMAVKIGDVNSSNSVSAQLTSEIRSASTAVYMRKVNGRIDFIASGKELLSGIQFDFSNLNTKDIVEINSGILDISKDDYHITSDRLALSWIKDEGQQIAEGDVLFSLSVDGGVKLENLLMAFQPEDSEWIDAYLNNSQIELTKDSNSWTIESENILEISNAPNPFIDFTRVNFEIVKEGQVEMELFDVSGRTIFKSSNNYIKGAHSFIIDPANLNMQAGLYILRLSANDKSYLHKISYVK